MGVASSTAGREKPPRYPPADEQMTKMRYNHTTERYPRRERLTRAAMWINLENVVPSGRSHVFYEPVYTKRLEEAERRDRR